MSRPFTQAPLGWEARVLMAEALRAAGRSAGARR